MEKRLRVKKKNERNLQELADSIRKSKIKIMGISEEREKGTKSLFKLMRTSQIYGKKWNLEFKKQTEHLIMSTQKGLLQDTVY